MEPHGITVIENANEQCDSVYLQLELVLRKRHKETGFRSKCQISHFVRKSFLKKDKL
jgi:hypothetical protein